MYRHNLNILKKWKISKNRKPLLLLGARQVGKTWLIKEFGRCEYKQTAYINFEHPNAPKELFTKDFDIKRIITVLNAYCGVAISAENTLIILDEIQSAKGVLTSLKYFCENHPEYHIVATGSLLGVNLHEGESFPVGKVDFMHLYPMSFEEFLIALGEEQLVNLLAETDWDSVAFFHEKLLNYLRYYMYVGGMPEAVKEFVETRDWRSTRRVQNAILLSYSNDFSKHAPNVIVPRIKMVWESIVGQLSKENKKFVYGLIREGARAKDFELAIEWITNAGLLHKVCCVNKAAQPLEAYKDFATFKLYHNDIGLLGAMAGLSARTVVDGDAVFTEFKGAMAEQFVFQQLMTKADCRMFYHTFENSKYEIDFLLQDEEGEVYPIEVKSGQNTKARSFRLFCQRNNPTKAIKLSTLPYKEEEGFTNVPLYGVGVIASGNRMLCL